MNPEVLSMRSTVLVVFLASFLIWLMFAGLVVLWFIDGRIKKEQAFHALVSTLIAWGAASMIKALYPTERPFELLGFMPITMTIPMDGSFPSEHAAASWSLATSIWLHNKTTGTLFILAAIGVSAGRILSGVHFPWDVVVGAIIGIATSALFVKLHLFKFLTGKRI